jgi:transposase
MTEADEKALFETLRDHGWMYQDEMVNWLLEERGVRVSQPTVSKLLRRNHWTRKALLTISNRRSEALRHAYIDDMAAYAADDLIFIDESLFNEKTGWRFKGYAPIGEPARYRANIARGNTYSILPAIDIDGYLPCVGIKEGYYSREDLLEWIETRLLPAIAAKYGPRPKVIVLDNCSTHISDAVIRLIQDAGHIIKFLPPYSPDFNPIELTFSVLKAWIRRHYWRMRDAYENYAEFLDIAIRVSACNRFTVKQFRHSAKGHYLIRDEWERLRARTRAFQQEQLDELDGDINNVLDDKEDVEEDNREE